MIHENTPRVWIITCSHTLAANSDSVITIKEQNGSFVEHLNREETWNNLKQPGTSQLSPSLTSLTV